MENIRKIVRQILKENFLLEDITIPINVGDEILGGKFLNKKVTVKSIKEDGKGGYLINGKPLLRFRIKKKLEESKTLKNIENDIIKEITVVPKEPIYPENIDNFQDFGKEKQYVFLTPNGFGYHLSFMESCLVIKD